MAEITTNAVLRGKLRGSASLIGRVHITATAGGESYTGTYDVTPSPDGDIVLATNGKLMASDVTVREIPFYEVSNPQEGITIYIGGK